MKTKSLGAYDAFHSTHEMFHCCCVNTPKINSKYTSLVTEEFNSSPRYQKHSTVNHPYIHLEKKKITFKILNITQRMLSNINLQKIIKIHRNRGKQAKTAPSS